MVLFHVLQSAIIPTQSLEVITISPFSRVPRAPYLMLPSWELQGDQSLLPVGVGPPDWVPALGPYLILWPVLVSWSVPPMNLVGTRPFGESECGAEREAGALQVARLLVCLGAPLLPPG